MTKTDLLNKKKVRGLKCQRCGFTTEEQAQAICSKCWGPLYVDYDAELIENTLVKEKIESREFTLWRYFELLPLNDPKMRVDLHDGGTPLHKCKRLSEITGLTKLYIKDDTVNPTLSFKDRPSSVGVSKCLELGIKTVGCASTGNLAAATAAHAAKAGLECFILVPESISESKIFHSAIHGATIIKVKGDYDEANRLGIMAADLLGWGLLNINIRSFYTEGSKTLGFEVCEQLGWQVPDHIIIPLGSGALLCAIARGFEELERYGLIPTFDTKFSGAQSSGCDPIVKAVQNRTNNIAPVKPKTEFLKSLAIGDPASGSEAASRILNTGGTADGISDEDVLIAERELAKYEGIFAEPAGAVTLAALKKKIERGEIDKSETVVLCVTGNGFKVPGAAIADQPVFPVIQPRIGALQQLIESSSSYYPS